jgi:hypothetical protein
MICFKRIMGVSAKPRFRPRLPKDITSGEREGHQRTLFSSMSPLTLDQPMIPGGHCTKRLDRSEGHVVEVDADARKRVGYETTSRIWWGRLSQPCKAKIFFCPTIRLQ